MSSIANYKQAGRQAGRRAGRQAGRQADGRAGRQTGRQTGRQAGRQAGRQENREVGTRSKHEDFLNSNMSSVVRLKERSAAEASRQMSKPTRKDQKKTCRFP